MSHFGHERCSRLFVRWMGMVAALAASCSSDNASPSRGATTNGATGSSTGTGSITTTGITGGTGTTSTQTGIISMPGAGGSGPGPGNVSPDAACAAQAGDTAAITADVFIMLDKSRSMNCPASDDACENPPTTLTHPTRWDAVTSAIDSFVNSPMSAGIGVGIGLFPASGNDCIVSSYATPTVPIAPVPANAAAITMAVAATTPKGGTPTLPALQGSIAYATMYTQATPGRTAAVAFVTDGQPNGCASTVAAAATAAATAYSGTPQIKTYVIGLGATASLDAIALAGSGGAVHYFPATGDVAARLGAALKTIASTVTCDYVIPTGNVDPMKVNITVTPGGGTVKPVGYVTGPANCTSAGGWYYDNSAQPTKITLCPQTCDPLKMSTESKVQVLYGCPTKGPGIN